MNPLRRRNLLRHAAQLCASTAGVALLSSACGFASVFNPARLPRIGYLSPGPREARANFVDAFLGGLQDLGYVEGQTIAIDWRFSPKGDDSQLPALAAELVALPIDVLVASNTPGAQAARQASSTMPIVAVNVANPVQTGLVASLARPGGNLTAVSGPGPGVNAKGVDLLRDVVPNLARLAAFVDPANPAHLVSWDEIRSAAVQAGLTAERIDVRSITDVEVAFDDAVSMQADAVIDAQSPLWLPVRERVAELALRHHLPALSGVREYAMSGLLMSYGPDQAAIYRRAAIYVDRVLKGAKPADLPVEQTTTFELLVNVTTLQALGLSIPPAVLPLVTGWVQ